MSNSSKQTSVAEKATKLFYGGARISNPLGLSKLEWNYHLFMNSEHEECNWLSPTKEAANSAKDKLTKLPFIKVGEVSEDKGIFTFIVSKTKQLLQRGEGE